MRRFRSLIHAESGAGKSWLLQSAPGPRLVLDAEGGSGFARRVLADGSTYVPHQLEWDPHYDLPDGITEDTTVIVHARDEDMVNLVTRCLQSGQHPFKTFGVDSLSDMQLTSKDLLTVASGKADTEPAVWGRLLTKYINYCQTIRNLTTQANNPLECVVVLCGSELGKDGRFAPQVQGALAKRLAGYWDLFGYLEVAIDRDTGERTRRLHIVNGIGHVAKDRTHFLTEVSPDGYIDNPDIEQMLKIMNPETEDE